MHRRLFLGATIAGLAAPGLSQPLQSLGFGDPDSFTTSGDGTFDTWRDDFFRRAVAQGYPKDVLKRELSDLSPNERVISLDRRQPEVSRPTGDYVKGAVSADRIVIGARKRGELTFLSSLQERFGVPGEVLIAIWGMESAFGAVQGDFDVVRSVATLSADGRRRGLFEENLLACMKLIQTGEATREQLKGSWAGAMGQTQFMPADYMRTAVDADGDGKRDIWRSDHDALASAANLLAKGGWKSGVSWQREVVLPDGFDFSVTEGPRLFPTVWEQQGVKTADGQGWAGADSISEAQLILPSGAGGPAFLALPNHFAIRRYNNSTAYALGVGLLADRIAGKAELVRAWPVEQGLASADRIGAQEALVKLGYNPGTADGVIGVNTRAALRGWQKAKGLPADGYLTVDLSKRLQAEAGIAVVPIDAAPVAGGAVG